MNLPSTIFVKQEPNDGDPILIASEDAADMVDNVRDAVHAGVYVLQSKVTVSAKVEVK